MRALVTNGLAVAIADDFTLAADNWPQPRVLEIAEPIGFQTYCEQS